MVNNIVHICNNFISSRVHQELISKISNKNDIFQKVFVPVRKKTDIGLNEINKKNIDICYFNYRFSFIKFFPLIKVLIVFLGFLTAYKKVDKNEIIIAHNFWSDGMIAFLAFLIFKTRYILVVRNTDMNIFLPKLKHYHWLMRLMVKNSESIVFVNKKYKENFIANYRSIYDCATKCEVIFNGVSDFWTENLFFEDCTVRDDNIIYVGAFNRNKNIISIVKSCENLLLRNPNLKLILVGGSALELKSLLNLDEIPKFIEVKGHINNKKQLLNLYRKAKIFIMPSFFETFGLVYIEALSQGCSIIHSKNQGIDGIFDEDYIVSVDPNNIEDISNKIQYLLSSFSVKQMSDRFKLNLVEMFDWDKIAEQYLGVFKK